MTVRSYSVLQVEYQPVVVLKYRFMQFTPEQHGFELGGNPQMWNADLFTLHKIHVGF